MIGLFLYLDSSKRSQYEGRATSRSLLRNSFHKTTLHSHRTHPILLQSNSRTKISSRQFDDSGVFRDVCEVFELMRLQPDFDSSSDETNRGRDCANFANVVLHRLCSLPVGGIRHPMGDYRRLECYHWPTMSESILDLGMDINRSRLFQGRRE